MYKYSVSCPYSKPLCPPSSPSSFPQKSIGLFPEVIQFRMLSYLPKVYFRLTVSSNEKHPCLKALINHHC